MKYDLGRDFDMYPMGRALGEKFRDEVLTPRLSEIHSRRQNEILEIDIDSCRSFGSSFLEEAFGGLVRKGRFSRAFLREHLRPTTSSAAKVFYADMIMDLIEKARTE